MSRDHKKSYEDLCVLRHKIVDHITVLRIYQEKLLKLAQSLEKDLEYINEIAEDLD